MLSTVTQNKDRPDSKWFMGKGKVEEVRALANELEATTIIVDQELSGSQVRNLEAFLDCKIIDRTQLILDIFAQRAKTREGIIQVELAQLSYLLPRLSGQGKNLSRLGGGIGTRGPGETKLETDRRHIRTRIRDLKLQLAEVTRHRQLYRARRRKNGIPQIALIGYTNAGKSTLLRELTAADVYVKDQLFATLDPTTRQLTLPSGKEVLLTDTVGFIQNLPHALISAFRATLEEVNEADIVLHVVDLSSDMREEMMTVVEQLLTELGAASTERITVYNKADVADHKQRLAIADQDANSLVMSAYVSEDLQRLLAMIQDRLTGATRTFVIPPSRGDILALTHRVGRVVQTEYNDVGSSIVTIELHAQDYDVHGYKLEPFAQ